MPFKLIHGSDDKVTKQHFKGSRPAALDWVATIMAGPCALSLNIYRSGAGEVLLESKPVHFIHKVNHLDRNS